MSTRSPDPLPLLASLVRAPSPSGKEERAAEILATWAAEAGLDPTVDEASVRIEVRGTEPGPTLLLASHLDTVPPGDGWARDPFGGEIEDGQLHGRGSVDGKTTATVPLEVACIPIEEKISHSPFIRCTSKLRE